MKKTLFVLLTVMLVLSLATAVYASNNDAKRWASFEVGSGIVDPEIGYLRDWSNFYHSVLNPGPDQVYRSLRDLLVAETALTFADLAGLTAAQVRDVAHDLGFAYYVTEVEALTDQIWAVQVEAKPGETGVLTQKFEAAYGPQAPTLEDPDAEVPASASNAWMFQRADVPAGYKVVTGEDYVGNYFNIDQVAATSGGTTKRYISISSPWSHAFLEEEMVVVGMAEVVESFAMNNIPPGESAMPIWWEIF